MKSTLFALMIIALSSISTRAIASDGDAAAAGMIDGTEDARLVTAAHEDTSADEALARALAEALDGEAAAEASVEATPKAGFLGRDGDEAATAIGSLLHRVVTPRRIDLLASDRDTLAMIHSASHVVGADGRIVRNLLEDCQNVHTTNALFLRAQVPQMLGVLIKYMRPESLDHALDAVETRVMADESAASVRAAIPAAFAQLKAYISAKDREPETGFAMTHLTSLVCELAEMLQDDEVSYAYLKSASGARPLRKGRAPTPTPALSHVTTTREVAEALLKRRLTLVERRKLARGEPILPAHLVAASGGGSAEATSAAGGAGVALATGGDVLMVRPLGLMAMSLTENKREGGGCYAGYAGRMGYLLLKFGFDFLGEGIGRYDD